MISTPRSPHPSCASEGLSDYQCWQCPIIYKGTHISLVCSSYLSMFIILANKYFQLWLLCISDLGLSTAGNCTRVSELNIFKLRKTTRSITLLLR